MNLGSQSLIIFKHRRFLWCWAGGRARDRADGRAGGWAGGWAGGPAERRLTGGSAGGPAGGRRAGVREPFKSSLKGPDFYTVPTVLNSSQRAVRPFVLHKNVRLCGAKKTA